MQYHHYLLATKGVQKKVKVREFWFPFDQNENLFLSRGWWIINFIYIKESLKKVILVIAIHVSTGIFLVLSFIREKNFWGKKYFAK